MFVHRTRGVVAATLLGLGLGACDDPAQTTDLRPEGPPEVLSVLVFTDAVNGIIEQATYCKPNDEKRPHLVGTPLITTEEVCPEDLSQNVPTLTNAYPDGWYVRIMFDELLDPEIETLTPVVDEETGEETGQMVGSIASTHPVKLECQSVTGSGLVEVDYDGYYSPAGNRITWPVGPSLVIKPNDPTLIATNTECQVTILDNVIDKTGDAVADGDRGPYKFKIAPIQVLLTDPADGDHVDATVPAVDGVFVQFNTEVKAESFCDEGAAMNECEFKFTPDEGGADFDGEGPEYSFFTNNAAHVDTDYEFSFIEGGKLADRCGKETTLGAPSAADGTLVAFTTNPFDLNGATIASGETSSAMKKLSLAFSNVIDIASLDSTEYSITPAPLSAGVDSGANDATFIGFFKINTDYTFTLNAGATVEDAYGEVFTNPEALTITWKTQPAITVTTSPADNAVVSRSAATTTVGATLSFNTAIKFAEITEGTDFEVTDGSGNAVTGWTVATTSCAVDSTSCSVTIKKAVPDGAYTFKLKAGATASDENGDTWTQAADKLIHFTVETTPPGPTPACL